MTQTEKNFPEQTIIELFKHGSMQVFNMLYDKYAAALFGFITRITGEMAAENILQQTFIELWKNREMEQRPNETIFMRLFKIARRLAIEEVRINYDSENHDLLGLVYSTEVENFLAGISKTEMIEEPAKAALKLMYFKCYTPEKAAATLNISTQILEMKVKLAIKKLNTMEV